MQIFKDKIAEFTNCMTRCWRSLYKQPPEQKNSDLSGQLLEPVELENYSNVESGRRTQKITEINLNQQIHNKYFGQRQSSSSQNRYSSKTVKKDRNQTLKRCITDTQSMSLNQIQKKSTQQPLNRQNEQFFTIRSTSSPQKRKSFKMLTRKGSFINSLSASVKSGNKSSVQDYRQITHMFDSKKSFQYGSGNTTQSMINSIYDMIRTECPRVTVSRQKPLKIENIVKMQLQENTFINNLHNKLEDYYTFYSEIGLDQKPYSQTETYRNNDYVCSYTKQSHKMGNNSIHMNLITFHIAVEPYKFIKWFNSVEVHARINNIQKISLQSFDDWPILRFQQFSNDMSLHGRQIFSVIRQIQVIKFQGDQNESIVQIDSTFQKSLVNFERLIRVQNKQNAFVQIYIESSETIRGNQNSYFKNKWKSFEDKLRNDKIILNKS